MYYPHSYTFFVSLLRTKPQAYCRLRGDEAHPHIQGEVLFYQTKYGLFTVVDIAGLSVQKGGEGTFLLTLFPCSAGENCSANLSSAGGRAFSAFLTDRFCRKDIVNHTILLKDASGLLAQGSVMEN